MIFNVAAEVVALIDAPDEATAIRKFNRLLGDHLDVVDKVDAFVSEPLPEGSTP